MSDDDEQPTFDHRAALADRWQFGSCCETRFDRVDAVWSALEAEGDAGAVEWSKVAADLAHPPVLEAFAEHVLEGAYERLPLLDTFAEHVAAVPGPAGAQGLWLRSRNAERSGEALESEAALVDAVDRDPHLAPALADLGWYAADRGDAVKARRLLLAAGADPGAMELRFLSQYTPDATPGVGRNEPCRCGSGRKYKHCCLGRTDLPLGVRVIWLAQKSIQYLTRPAHHEVLVELAISTLDADSASIEAVQDRFGDPFLIDVALWEGGVLEAFLAERGPLLPADELTLGESWLGSTRAIWEVVAVHHGVGLDLRDEASGREVHVVERTGTDDTLVGDRFLGVVVPVGDEHRIAGTVMRVTEDMAAELSPLLAADPSAEDMARWYGDRRRRRRAPADESADPTE